MAFQTRDDPLLLFRPPWWIWKERYLVYDQGKATRLASTTARPGGCGSEDLWTSLAAKAHRGKGGFEPTPPAQGYLISMIRLIAIYESEVVLGQGFTYSNAMKRRMREKSRSFSVTRTQPASRHDRASRMSFANALETRAISSPSWCAISASRSPERCQASGDGVIVRLARSKILITFRSNAFRSLGCFTPARSS